MSSLSPAWKELRRQSIFRTASAVFMGSTIHANDRGAIRAIISSHPAKFQSVEKMYGSDMVVQIISSLLDNGTFASESNDRLEAPKTHRPSPVRDKQHDALEQEAAQSEAKALDEASRADLAIYDGDQCGEQINVAGCDFCRTIIVDPADMYGRNWTDRRLFRAGFHQIAVFVPLILVICCSA